LVPSASTPFFPPQAASNHGEQRGRYQNQIDSAQVQGREQARHVADHPAAQCDQQRTTVGPFVAQSKRELLNYGQFLGGLAGFNFKDVGVT